MIGTWGVGIAGVTIAAAALWASLAGTPVRAEAPPIEGLIQEFTLTEGRPEVAALALTRADGTTLSLDDLEGRVVLLNFWATWCAPCVVEMPALDRLEAALGSDDFVVITASLDRQGHSLIVPFFEEHELTALEPLHLESPTAMKDFGLRGLPVTILIDREGQEIGRLMGDAKWDSFHAKELMRWAIAETESG